MMLPSGMSAAAVTGHKTRLKSRVAITVVLNQMKRYFSAAVTGSVYQGCFFNAFYALKLF